ncbi:hypothetical protein Tcan_13074 [Toxocara canis]|uniref:Uncharacterized protein n=1 Tax=Toxocara canis TaxID=6265 RepID=A0A0B2UWM6_TOXCA|nr:hypothetical protein Tcan_13074 [Toxocara canis]
METKAERIMGLRVIQYLYSLCVQFTYQLDSYWKLIIADLTRTLIFPLVPIELLTLAPSRPPIYGNKSVSSVPMCNEKNVRSEWAHQNSKRGLYRDANEGQWIDSWLGMMVPLPNHIFAMI